MRKLLAVMLVLGVGITVNAQTNVYSTGGDFEDGEINPGKLGGVVNTTAYDDTQPDAFGGEAYGWQNYAANHLTGDTTIVDTLAYTGSNCAEVENRTLRSDIEHTLAANSIYTYTFWINVPSGMSGTFVNKIVCKDQTNTYLFVSTGNDDYRTVRAFDTWYRRSVSFDTTGYANVGVPIDFRFGLWITLPGLAGDGFTGYTDSWTVDYVADSPVVSYWSPIAAVLDQTEWRDAGNWTSGVPNSDDHVIIQNQPFPIIDEEEWDVNILTPSWHDGVHSAVRVATGGAIEALSFTRLSQGTDAVGFLDITGGQVKTSTLQIYSFNGTGYGRGYVNLDEGSLECAALGWDPEIDNNIGASNIDLEEGAYLILDGDQTAAIEWWTFVGHLTAADGTNEIAWDFNDTNPGQTTAWAVPTSVVKGGGFNTPSAASQEVLRHGFDMDINAISATWMFSEGAGVVREGHPWLGDITPNKDAGYGQACIFHNYAVPWHYSQASQELTTVDDGRFYEVNWSEAMGSRPPEAGLNDKSDLSVYMEEVLDSGAAGAQILVHRTEDIWYTSMVAVSARFLADLTPGAPDPVVGYRLLFDARGLDHDNGGAYSGFVIVDSASVNPGGLAGDLNCDGVTDNFDIDPFVLLLTGTPPDYPEYYAQFPDCDHMLADCNNDGSVNNFDIDPFVAILTG